MGRNSASFAAWWRALLKVIRRQDSGWALALIAFLAALTGTLAAVMSDVANTAVVQTVAKLLVRAQPF